MELRRTKLLAVAALALGGIAASARAGTVFSNGFELVTGSDTPFSSAFETVDNGGTLSGGVWTVAGGSVDWIQSYWPAEEGSYSIDLQGGPLPDHPLPGSITAHFNTKPGQLYQLSFYMSGNPDGLPTTKDVTISGGHGEAFGPSTFTYDTSSHGNSEANMDWVLETTTFKGIVDGQTSLTFASGDLLSPYGAALDNVLITTPDVTPSSVVPLPSAVSLGMGLCAGLLIMQGIRSRRKVAAV